MFELFLALKYLVPRRSRLSASLIALLSVGVISLVVWLILVFLSVTHGIEKQWLSKLTVLNAPLRITPTRAYYDSYYYQIDAFSDQSGYTLKSLSEKKTSSQTDPYAPNEDPALPLHFPKPDRTATGELKDPVKGLVKILDVMAAREKGQDKNLVYQEFELSGALMRLQLFDPQSGEQSYLTQASYLFTIPSKSPDLAALVDLPQENDINRLLRLSQQSTELCRQDAPSLQRKASLDKRMQRSEQITRSLEITKLKTQNSSWQIPISLLPEGERFAVEPKIERIDVPLDPDRQDYMLWRKGEKLFLAHLDEKEVEVSSHLPLILKGGITLNVLSQEALRYQVEGLLQRIPIAGMVSLEGLEIAQVSSLSKAPSAWIPSYKEGELQLPINEEKEVGVLLAKSFQESRVQIGDRGYLSYASTTTGSTQEQRLPIFVCGFYDPGVLSIGNKCVLVPPEVTRTVSTANGSFHLDKTQSTGFLVWFSSLDNTPQIASHLQEALKREGLDLFWKVTPFYEYDFAKELLHQFQSDKMLFMLVGVIILIVGCCNIISMLSLLVNDKKKEIGILQAMGASGLRIATVFGLCGMVMGLLSSILGTLAALITLDQINPLLQLISALQGHQALSPQFFGSTLPTTLSFEAVGFVLIVTPLLALIAGLIPAVKACRVQPANLLRNE